jgi:hypothetical protein
MAEVRHAPHPEAGVHNLLVGLRSHRGPRMGPKRHLTRCGQWVEQHWVVWPGSPRRVTCAACRQAGLQG